MYIFSISFYHDLIEHKSSIESNNKKLHLALATACFGSIVQDIKICTKIIHKLFSMILSFVNAKSIQRIIFKFTHTASCLGKFSSLFFIGKKIGLKGTFFILKGKLS